MKYIRPALGYTLAVLSLFVALATFMGNPYFGRAIVDATGGISISPRTTGGAVVHTIDHGGYETAIHETVFQGLLSDRKTGFVQVDWVKKTEIPATLSEEIDFDRDGTMDFKVECDMESGEAVVTPYIPEVLSKVETFERDNGFTVRVRLTRSVP